MENKEIENRIEKLESDLFFEEMADSSYNIEKVREIQAEISRLREEIKSNG